MQYRINSPIGLIPSNMLTVFHASIRIKEIALISIFDIIITNSINRWYPADNADFNYNSLNIPPVTALTELISRLDIIIIANE